MAIAKASTAKLRDELLNGEIFYTLKEAQIVIENWRQPLQHGASAFIAGIPTAGTRGTRLAGKARSANASSKLTFQSDHSVGAGQS